MRVRPTPHRRPTIAALGLLLAAAVAGCSDDPPGAGGGDSSADAGALTAGECPLTEAEVSDAVGVEMLLHEGGGPCSFVVAPPAGTREQVVASVREGIVDFDEVRDSYEDNGADVSAFDRGDEDVSFLAVETEDSAYVVAAYDEISLDIDLREIPLDAAGFADLARSLVDAAVE